MLWGKRKGVEWRGEKGRGCNQMEGEREGPIGEEKVK